MTRQISDYRLYAAIQRQPEELDRLLSAQEPVDLAAETLSSARRVYTVGIGTSWNAASVAAMLLRAAGLDAAAWSSHDFVAYPPHLGSQDAVVLFTHSGTKRFSRRALAVLGEQRVPVVLITSSESAIGVADLPMGTTILRTTEREPSSMFTVSHTAAMLLAARIADAVQEGATGDLAAVPQAVADALQLEADVRELAEAWAERRNIVALGAGPHEVSAHEAGIKIAEAARRPVRGHAVEQFLHGPQVQVTEDDAFLLFAGGGPGLERTEEAATFVRTLGCAAAWVAPVAAPAGTEWLRIADVGEWLAPIVEAVPGQLLAGHLAALAGVDADNFRADDPVFRQARTALEL